MSGFRRSVSKLTEFVVRERRSLLLLSGFVLVGAIMFEAGFLRGSSVAARPIVVEKPVGSECQGGEVAGAAVESAGNTAKAGAGTATGSVDARKCAFVGSKNSTLYHLPTCATAKRIKPENLVCFTSAEDAQSKGYKAGCVK